MREMVTAYCDLTATFSSGFLGQRKVAVIAPSCYGCLRQWHGSRQAGSWLVWRLMTFAHTDTDSLTLICM